MGLSTIVNMIVFVCVKEFPGSQYTFSSCTAKPSTDAQSLQNSFVYLAWTLWWIVAILAVSTAICLPYLMSVSANPLFLPQAPH